MYATLKNLNKIKPELFNKSYDVSNDFFFKNSGGLRKKGFYKSSNQNKPLITIITVSLNSEKTLEKSLLSVLNQTYDNVEYILIDGDSSDKTLDIIKKYENSLDFWISEKDEGIFNAINKGIQISSGDIIGILNSDDIYTKDALNLVKTYFSNNVDFLFGSVEKERLLSGFNKEKIKWKFNIYPAHSSGFFISKKAQLKVGLYDEKFKLHADYDLIYKLTCNLKLKGMSMKKSEVTGVFNTKGKSSEENKMEYFYEEFKIRKKNQQNILFITSLLFLKIIYFYLFKIKIFKTLFKFIQKSINF